MKHLSLHFYQQSLQDAVESRNIVVLEQSSQIHHTTGSVPGQHMMLVLEANSTDVTFCQCQFESPELSADSRNH
jgi:hypothetical protein